MTTGLMPFLVFYAFLAIAPWIFGFWSIWTDAVIFGLFALSYNILLGQTGMVSFGHAAYFAMGAYGTAMFLVKPMGIPRAPLWAGWFCIPAGVLLATAVGLGAGILVLRRRGTYFALITLAIAQTLYYAFSTNFYGYPEQWFHLTYLDPTGGSDGLTGVNVPAIFGMQWVTPVTWYYFVLIIIAVAVLVVRSIYRSGFGEVLKAIRDDEVRARMLGYNIDRCRLTAFTLSAMFSGLAGSLLALNIGFAGVDLMYWTASGEVIIMTLLGGMLQFYGPLVGAVFYIFIKDGISMYTIHWMIIAGALVCAETLLYQGKGLVDLGISISNQARRKFSLENHRGRLK
jgi:branched-chain amino acid transport system permease protein